MSAHVLVDLSNLIRQKEARLCRAFYHFSTTSLINLIIQEHYSSYNTKINLLFLHRSDKTLPLARHDGVMDIIA